MDVFLGPAHFGDVDQAFNAVFKFNKCTIISDIGDVAFKACADNVFRFDAIPRIRTELFHAKRDALCLWIDLDDLNIHGLANFDNL